MQVLSWQHKRRRLVAALAQLDAQVAARASSLEEAWIEKYRLAPHEAQVTPTAVEGTPAGDAGVFSHGTSSSVAPSQPAAPAAPVQTIPEYLL